MSKRRLQKTVRSCRGRRRNLTHKKRRNAARQSVWTRTRTSKRPVKATIEIPLPPLPASTPDCATAQAVSDSCEAPAELEAKTPSPQQRLLELGRNWKQLLDQGDSLAEVAQKIDCSRSQVRNLAMLANLPKDLEEAYLQGKVGRKKVLAMVRARRNAVAAKEVGATGELLPGNPGQYPVPAPNSEERQKKGSEYAKLIIDWAHSTDLAPCFWSPLFQQINLALYGPFPWLFRNEAPRSQEIRPHADPVKVIKACKVEGGDERSMPDIINDHVTWLARWIQRVIPDPRLMRQALAIAEATLVREAWRTSWC